MCRCNSPPLPLPSAPTTTTWQRAWSSPTDLRSGRTPDNAEYIRELSARYRQLLSSTQAQVQAARQTNMLESKQKKWSAAAARAVAQANKSEVPDQYWVFEDAGVIADRFLRGVEYLRESLSVLHADRGALLASQHIVGGGKVGAVRHAPIAGGHGRALRSADGRDEVDPAPRPLQESMYGSRANPR